MIFELVENIRKPYPPQRDKTKVLSLKVKVEISKLICLLFSHTPVGRWPGELLAVAAPAAAAAATVHRPPNSNHQPPPPSPATNKFAGPKAHRRVREQ